MDFRFMINLTEPLIERWFAYIANGEVLYWASAAVVFCNDV
jgi:hypothetical protein